MLSFEQCFIIFLSFSFLLVFDVGGLGFEFCVFVASWRHSPSLVEGLVKGHGIFINLNKQ